MVAPKKLPWYDDFTAMLVGAILASLLFTHDAKAADPEWTTTNKVMFASFVAVNVADVLQSQQVDPGSGYRETNPLYGRYPSDARLIAVKSLTVGGVYWLIKDKDPAHRNLMLGIGTMLIGAAVANNYSVGLSIKF